MSFDYNRAGLEGRYATQSAVNRYNTIRRFLQPYLKAQTSLVEIACGEIGPQNVLPLPPESTYIGVDISLPALKNTRQTDASTLLVCADACHLPFQPDIIPAALLLELLEHIPDPGKAVEELHRSLVPGGIACVTVPKFDFPLFRDQLIAVLRKVIGYDLERDEHLRVFSTKQVKDLLATNGFSVVEERHGAYLVVLLQRIPQLNSLLLFLDQRLIALATYFPPLKIFSSGLVLLVKKN